MTNCKPEEFQAWLEEKELKRENIIHPLSFWKDSLIPAAKTKDNWIVYLRQQNWGTNHVLDKWLAERERERANLLITLLTKATG